MQGPNVWVTELLAQTHGFGAGFVPINPDWAGTLLSFGYQ